MEDGVHSRAGSCDGSGVSEVTDVALDSLSDQIGCRTARENADPIPACEELIDDVSTEETAGTTGDESEHQWLSEERGTGFLVAVRVR